MDVSSLQTPGEVGRERILQAVLKTLAEQRERATEIKAVVEDSGIPLADVAAEFPEPNDLMLAVARRIADQVSYPLTIENAEPVDTRAKLIEFGTGVHEAYSSVVAGFIRVLMTEGSRHHELKSRVYAEGPGAVTAALQEFLKRAASTGQLDAQQSDLTGEILMGLLREPLYQAISLHSEELTFYGSGQEAVEAAVDMFLYGCNGSDGDRGSAS